MPMKDNSSFVVYLFFPQIQLLLKHLYLKLFLRSNNIQIIVLQLFFNLFKHKMSKSTKVCYYITLGVQKTSTPQQIKKAYKKLAIKWHPDKNPDNKQQAKQKFRQIAQAYQYLSNQQKRKVYDKYGHNGPQSTNYHQNFGFSDADNIFKHFFRNNPFQNDDDDQFFSSIFGKRTKNGSSNGSGYSGSSFGSFGFGPSLFKSKSLFQDDDFFKGMGSGSHFSSFRSSSFGDDGLDRHPGLTKSVSTTTRTVNGKTVTTKKTTVVNQDGSKQVTQQVIQGGMKTQKKYSLGPGQSGKQNFVKY